MRTAPDAPVCGDFVKFGWCELGAACGERHSWECKEWTEKGTCRLGGKCGLKHVLKAEKGRAAPASAATSVPSSPVRPGVGGKRKAAGVAEMEDEDEGASVEAGPSRKRKGESASAFFVDRDGDRASSTSLQPLLEQDDYIQFDAFGGTSSEGEDDDDEDGKEDDEEEAEDHSDVESDLEGELPSTKAPSADADGPAHDPALDDEDDEGQRRREASPGRDD